MKSAPPAVVLLSKGDQNDHEIRLLLREAMLMNQLLPCWKEYVQGKGDRPFTFPENMDLPAVYINEQKVWNAGTERELPSIEDLAFWLQRPPQKRTNRVQNLRHHLSFFMTLFIAFFPKCPFCWAAYMSLLGSWGLTNFPYQSWLLPLFISLLFLNWSSLFLSRKRHGMGPLLTSMLGTLFIILNRFYFDVLAMFLLGTLLLLTASLWNSLPPRVLRSLKCYVKVLFTRKSLF